MSKEKDKIKVMADMGFQFRRETASFYVESMEKLNGLAHKLMASRIANESLLDGAVIEFLRGSGDDFYFWSFTDYGDLCHEYDEPVEETWALNLKTLDTAILEDSIFAEGDAIGRGIFSYKALTEGAYGALIDSLGYDVMYVNIDYNDGEEA